MRDSLRSLRKPVSEFEMPLLWTVKHRPKTLSDVAGNKEAKESFIAWINSWQKGIPPKKAALLHGPPGTGKTVTVQAAANDFKFDLVEINASDKRTEEHLRKIAGGAATQGELFGRNRLILLDEIDGINLSEDKGAISTLVETIEHARCPIALTANDPWDPKIRPLRELCFAIEFRRLGVRDSLPYLKKLCVSEGIEADEQALRLIIDRNKGDMRSIINDLQTFTTGRKKLNYADVEWLSWRDRKDTIFDALRTVFSSKSGTQARRATDMADVDLDMFFEWIYENAPLQLTDPRDLANALGALSKADLYLARMKRLQAWQLLPFAIDQMTIGVALSKERTKPAWTPMRFPSRITSLSRTRKERALRSAIGAKIGAKSHVSSMAAVKHFLPYLSFVFQNNSEMASDITGWLDLNEEMVQYLSGKSIKEKERKARKPVKVKERQLATRKAARRRRAASS
mgnify:CR=1 FL=1